MSRQKLYHIYYNTAGNSGLYLKPILDALGDSYEQRAFVNRYYPLNSPQCEKIFFEITEKNEHNCHKLILKLTHLRKVIRYLELKQNNKKLLRKIKRDHPEYINYSLTNMPDALGFLKKIRNISSETKLIITCHDVSPFRETHHIPYKKIYDFADYLLVHNENSIEILIHEYGIKKSKILYHPFPIIDISLLKSQKINADHVAPVFLMIGVMREEKGIQYLVDAWERLGEKFAGQLIIAGYKPDNVCINFDKIIGFKNVTVIPRSLSDDEYVDLIDRSDYVVFPYNKVCNSGVLSTVVSKGKVPITTLLPTFMESKYVFPELMCAPADSDALKKLINEAADNFSDNYHGQSENVLSALKIDRATFASQVKAAYETIK